MRFLNKISQHEKIDEIVSSIALKNRKDIIFEMSVMVKNVLITDMYSVIISVKIQVALGS